MSLWGQPGIFGPQPGSLSFQLDHTQGAGQEAELHLGVDSRLVI